MHTCMICELDYSFMLVPEHGCTVLNLEKWRTSQVRRTAYGIAYGIIHIQLDRRLGWHLKCIGLTQNLHQL